MIETKELLRRYGVNPKQSLAQNFLMDATHLARIAAAAGLASADTVLEIGPGLGALTQYLAAQAGQVFAVELDNRLIELLRAHFADQPHVQIVHGDILTLEPGALVRAAPNAATAYKVVANLPYYITNAVLRHLLETDCRPTQIVVLVQKEVAERVCAQPGDLSLLAVSVQFYATPTLVQHVPASAFYPPPKVDSAILHLAVRPEPAVPDVNPTAFFRVVRAGFSQKRKQLINTLSGGLHLPKADLTATLTNLGIDPTRRAETLTLAEWGVLTRSLAANVIREA
jgi:16S rRNA (adenine1518-N6/adenine1519-N6)-dimethyltransferase